MTQIQIIDAADFVALIKENKDIKVLDIRSELEHNALALNYKATHTPLHLVDLDNYPNAEEKTYILCKMGPRAFKMAEALAERGHTNLIVIDGGIVGCIQSGATIKQAENQPTSEEIMQAVQESFQEFMMQNT